MEKSGNWKICCSKEKLEAFQRILLLCQPSRIPFSRRFQNEELHGGLQRQEANELPSYRKVSVSRVPLIKGRLEEAIDK